MTQLRLSHFLACAALAAVGGGACHSGGGKPGDGDSGAPPAPMAMHVGPSGVTAGLVGGGSHAAYLLNPTMAMAGKTQLGVAGELHVTSTSGKDFKVAANVLLGRYVLAPDGNSLFYVGFDLTSGPATGAASLNFLSLATDGAMPQVIAADGAPVSNKSTSMFSNAYVPDPLQGLSLFSPSSKFFVTRLAPAKDSTTPDLHVYDTSNGHDVYQRPNGASVYSQLIMPDDTLIFQDTAAGTSPDAPPVQTLYWTKLGGSASGSIATRTAQFVPTADNKTLLILRTNGDLLTWSIGSSAPAASTPLASNVAEFTLGPDGNGPVAYVGMDHSLHVVTTDGSKKLDLDAASANADYQGPLLLSGNGKELYFWQNVEAQNKRGTLLHVGAGGGTPSKVGDQVSLVDVNATDSALVFENGVDAVGQFGNVAWAQLDGSKPAQLGSGAVVGGLRVAQPDGWAALHLTGAALDANPADMPADGSEAISGMLAFDDSAGNESILDGAVHSGVFGFSPSGKEAFYAAGAAWNATALNWVGALTLLSSAAPTKKVDGKVAGVSELLPAGVRALWVDAPLGNPAGIYYVTY